MDLNMNFNENSSMSLINLRKKFRNKEQIQKFFQEQSKI